MVVTKTFVLTIDPPALGGSTHTVSKQFTITIDSGPLPAPPLGGLRVTVGTSKPAGTWQS